MAIIYFILILGITVLVHELGHFIFAKKYGVYVYEFSIGMGPRLFKFNRKNDETDYSIRLLPIGGYVQMAGESVEVDEKIPKEKRLQAKSCFQRFMIMVAGVMMNFILALVLLFVIGISGNISTNNLYIDDSSINGLNSDAKIVKVNNHFVNNYDKLALELTIAGKNEFNLTVKENGKTKDILIKPISVGKSNLIYGKDYGFTVADLNISSSKIKGLKKGDVISSIDGKTVDSYIDLLTILSNVDKKFTLGILDKKEEFKEFNIQIKENKKDTLAGYSYGFYLKGKSEKGFFAAIKYAFLKFFSTVEQMVFTVIYLVTGKISLSMLSGPVGIFQVVNAYSKTGILNILSLLSLICVNVGFINILPLPAFDGGHVLFIVIEKIKGSKVDPKLENTIHNIGFILLMILMVLVTYNDILRLIKG
ncbi:MAG: RIP metalloprotease RseP [bacterium]|nr:RIP metalloprotease RseP [bacterium]